MYRSNRGFTLLELMIALGIFALIAAASYTLLRGEILSQQRLLEGSERLSHWQRGMLRLSRDIIQIVPRSIREDYGSREAALVGDSSGVTFTRGGWDNPLQRQRSHLQRVHYEVRVDGDYSYLQRSFWSVLDRAPGSEPVRQVLIPAVASIHLRYYDTQENEWRDQWPPASGDNTRPDELPGAVEIILTSTELGEIRRLFSVDSQRVQK